MMKHIFLAVVLAAAVVAAHENITAPPPAPAPDHQSTVEDVDVRRDIHDLQKRCLYLEQRVDELEQLLARPQ